MRTIGFVGLGNMGARMARNLAGAGFDLVVRDADAERQARVARELGAAAAGAPVDFAAVDALVTMLPTGVEVRGALLEWEGGIAGALAPGTVVVDMSSASPVGTRELGPVLAERGLALVDAPVSGGVVGAENGTLSIMVGTDDETAAERVWPVLEALGKDLVSVGRLGNGHAVKALNNYANAAGFTATAEALLIGARFGLDPRDVLAVINASSGRNFASEETFEPAVLSRTFDDGFGLPLMAKDLRIAEELRASVGVEAPACELMARLWAEALDAEGASADYTAAVRHWERLNGFELPG